MVEKLLLVEKKVINISSFEIHIKKYELLKKNGNNKENSHMTRIEALFEACFHLIEACVSFYRLHINKQQLVRNMLEENKEIFEEDTKLIWSNFQELENQIRPGQAYGGKINGEQLKRAKEIFDIIEDKCNLVLRKLNKDKFPDTNNKKNAERV